MVEHRARDQIPTDPRRTQIGGRFGTEGFAATELSVDAHSVGPQADIYSIGQIIGWALTEQWPRAQRAGAAGGRAVAHHRQGRH